MKGIDSTGLINVVIGVATLASGLSGRYGLPGPPFVLPFSDSNIPLLLLGAAIIAHGAYQIFRNRPR